MAMFMCVSACNGRLGEEGKSHLKALVHRGLGKPHRKHGNILWQQFETRTLTFLANSHKVG